MDPVQEQLQSFYCSFNDFSVDRMTCGSAENKTVPGTGPNANPPSPPQTYHIIPLLYNLGTEDKPIYSDFQFEGCEVETNFGIQCQEQPASKRLDYSVRVKFDMGNMDQIQMINAIEGIHQGSAHLLHSLKGTVKMHTFNKEMPEATGLKHPVYRPRDEVSGEVIAGRAPTLFVKLFNRGKPPMVEQTLFTGLDGNPIPWKLLENVEMKFVPLFHIKRIYVGGGKASIQMELLSAIVTSVRARNTTTKQLLTINRIANARPDLQDSLAAQLAKLTKDREDQFIAEQGMMQTTEQGEQADPTYAAAIGGL